MQAIDGATSAIAALLEVDPDEVIFTSGATEANNLALIGIAKCAAHGDRRRILLGATEHKCVLEIGRVLHDELDFTVAQIPVDSVGLIDMGALEQALDDDVLLVSVMPVNNEIGTIQDIATISRMIMSHGGLLHCDAAQAPCALDLAAISQYVDLMSLSSHKMYGPMGVGALYVRRCLQERITPVIHGGGQQGGIRSGTLPTFLCVGLGAAAELVGGSDAADERGDLARRRDLFADLLEDLPCRTWLNGPTDTTLRHPGCLNIGFSGIPAADLLSRIQPKLAASTGSACTSGIHEPSHVLRAIGLDSLDAASSVRFSLGRHTSDEEVFEAGRIIRSALDEITKDGPSL